jgi:anti-sigma factor RsiW
VSARVYLGSGGELGGIDVTTLLQTVRDRMECMRVNPLLQAYLDGELDEDGAQRVSRHLDACRRCGLAAETFRDIKTAVSRLGDEPDREAVQRLRRFAAELAPDDEA